MAVRCWSYGCVQIYLLLEAMLLACLCIVYESVYSFILFLNNVKHCFSAQLEWNKKPEITSGVTVLCQTELNGCWQKPVMDSWWFHCSSWFHCSVPLSLRNLIWVVTSSPRYLWLHLLASPGYSGQHSLVHRDVGKRRLLQIFILTVDICKYSCWNSQ